MYNLILWLGALQAAERQDYALRRELLRLLAVTYVVIQLITWSLGMGYSWIPGVVILPKAAATYLFD